MSLLIEVNMLQMPSRNVKVDFWIYFEKIENPATAIANLLAILDPPYSGKSSHKGLSGFGDLPSYATSLVVSAAAHKIDRRFAVVRNLLFALFLLEKITDKVSLSLLG
jgi:hypothetical protein